MKAFVAADNMITSLGFDSAANMGNLKNSLSGIRLLEHEEISPFPFYASAVNTRTLNDSFEKLSDPEKYTRLEKMFILSISDALSQTDIDVRAQDTLLVICTTKGNIDLLEPRKKNMFDPQRSHLYAMANAVGNYFGSMHEPLVISNACISGILGIITALRLIQGSQYRNIIVSGGDIISEFTVSGFHAFKAVSPLPCRPFDAARNGVTLGEGCGTIILTADAARASGKEPVYISGGATSNDANHISGPSRTGEGLYISIRNALKDAGLGSNDIHYISGHGTATLYNDEMEAKAVMLAGLQHACLNSFKGYFGHTLGAAGVIETIATLHSLQENIIIKSFGYETCGVSEPVKIADRLLSQNIRHSLKTGAGFGGCNAAIVLSKYHEDFNNGIQ